jgi:uncharacterized protein YbjT (DUF2867 family)
MAERKIIAVVGASGAQGGGLVRAILNDPNGGFAVRAITRDIHAASAKALAAQGVEVVAADLDNPASVKQAFTGAYGAYCVTFYWAHFSPAKELAHAKAMAEAARDAGIQHAIWSTLEDTRTWVPLSDNRMPTLMGKYKVPHFDAKGEADHFFVDADVPTTFLLASFYWENLISGLAPQRGDDGRLAITLPMGDKKLAGIGAEDIGKCAYGIFKQGRAYIGERIGIASDHLTGVEIAAALTRALDQEVRYNEVSPAVFRSFGFPGADDIGNMFQFYRDFEQVCLAARDIQVSRTLNPSLQTFDGWLAEHKDRIPLG